MKIKGFNNRLYEGSEFTTIIPQDTFKKSYCIDRMLFLKVLLIIASLILILQLINLQMVQGKFYKMKAEENRIRVKDIKPLRGIIYDKKGNQVVKNVPTFSLFAIPIDIKQQNFPYEKIIASLNDIYPQKTPSDLYTKLSTYSYIPVVLIKNLEYEEGMKLLPIIKQWPGVYLQENFRREYPYKELLAHVLGYISFVQEEDLKNDEFYGISDSIGVSGVENMYEKELRGVKGTKKVQVNSLGKEGKIIETVPSRGGGYITLTVDLEVQKALERILKEAMEKFGVERAGAIVMNPQDGSIVSMISLPSYDNNIFGSNSSTAFEDLIKNSNQPLFNRVIKGKYPPGSTFKLIVGAGALQEGIVDENMTVHSTGGIAIGEWFFPDWNPLGHGVVNIRGAIANSVNTYFYTVGGGYETQKGLGLSGISTFARLFNLGKTTGIDIPGEASGFLPTEEWKLETKGEEWYLGDTYHISIGQGDILVTPLQIALWTSFFANEGTLYVPHVVLQEPRVIDKDFISPHNIEIIRLGLRDTVTYGSARSLEALKIQAAGKTGSAQFSKNKKPHGWFTGFAPFDKPEIVITVLMEEGDGAQSATTVAREFLDWYFNTYSPLESGSLL